MPAEGGLYSERRRERRTRQEQNPMTSLRTFEFRIVRRAFSEYQTVERFEGSWLAAVARAEDLERTNRDGEYLLRRLDEPNWSPAGYIDQGVSD